jgi:transposase
VEIKTGGSMGQERLSMKKTREVLRLKLACGLSHRQIAKACGVSRPVISGYIKKCEEAGVRGWSEIELLSEEGLEKKLNLEKKAKGEGMGRALPDHKKIREELRDKNVTLTLLWTEYKEQFPDGYEYVQFCNLYRQWQKKQDYCMRQEHKAGEKVFVDYCDGKDMVDRVSGEVKQTQLFVAVWGASCYTYAEASLSQNMFCWTSSHVKALRYFNCVPQIIMPDNLKSGINKPCRYEPEINGTYLDLSRHYNFAAIPARVRKPRDKAKVENGVLVSQRWILAALRHRRFYNLVELNEAIGGLLEKLNGKVMRKIKKSRRELFVEVDQPNARPLPGRAWEYCEWRKASSITTQFPIG